MSHQVLALALVVLFLCGCSSTADGSTTVYERQASVASEPTEGATAPVTWTPAAPWTATPPSTATSTATVAPTATPTPTPTALPVVVSGNPRRAVLTRAEPQSGAPCGVVDLLDCPLNPPYADGIIRGNDFGDYRAYYGGYHTGEDWWGPGGRSLGLRVHSIGHGKVTYAAPRGWGADGGTVVIQHVLSDGSTFFSFYGHLEPSSVVLHAGDCVARGELVGRIGRPSSPPHLHFEIRDHTPDGPGPGYWPTDPSLAGWQPPSQTIWEDQIANSPGVVWMRPAAAWGGTKVLGVLDDGTLVVLEDGRVLGISALDGNVRWSETSSIRATRGVVDNDRSMLYTANHYTGWIEAFLIQKPREGPPVVGASPLVRVWEIKLDAHGSVTLTPLPAGGVVASFRQEMVGISASGRLLWTSDTPSQVLDWIPFGDRLLFSTTGENASIWEVDETGVSAWAMPDGGQLSVHDDQLVVYGEDGVYRTGPNMPSAELLYALPKGRPEEGDLVTLTEGGLLLIHADAFDKRLIVLDGNGRVRWQRSIARALRENEYHLLMVEGRPLILSHGRSPAASELSVLGIELNRGVLVRLFAVRGWIPRPGESWAYALGDGRILLNIRSGSGAGRLVALDARLAGEAVGQAMISQ